jgi:small-conductance mechanosensitive channel
MNEFLQKILVEFGGFSITIWHVLLAIAILFLLLVLDWILVARFLPPLFTQFQVETARRRQVARRIQPFFLYLAILIWVVFTGIDFTFYQKGTQWIGFSTLLRGLIIWQFARIADILIGRVVILNSLQKQREQGSTFLSGGKNATQNDWKKSNLYLRYVVYLFAILLVVQVFQVDFLLFEGKYGKSIYSIRASNVLFAALAVMFARLLTWLTIHLFLVGFYKKRKLNIGYQYAINQLISYFIYFIAGIIALHLLGVDVSVIAGGTVALLVGVGIGLQQTFNDFFSGILLLFERSVEVGDVVEIEGLIGDVKRIGLRTSIIQSQDNRTVIVPNSKLVNDNVTNWSHGDDVARFFVTVGVGYESDVHLVKKLLIQAAHNQHPKILSDRDIIVRLTDFGDSALLFEVHFWSEQFMRIDDLKSDLRFDIVRLFNEHHISIPFPQQEVSIKKMPAG